MSAGWQKLFSENPRIGFLSHAEKFQAALDRGEVLAPAKDAAQMRLVIFNDYVDAAMGALFMAVVLAMLVFAIRAAARPWPPAATAVETAPVWREGVGSV